MIRRPPRSTLLPNTTRFRSLLGKLDALNLTDNTIVIFTTDHGFYFGEHDYFGKAEWVHEPDARVSENSNLPEWLSESDRKSTRLNSSHANISYAVFCLKKKY